MGFGVWGLGFGVWGLGFGVWGLGFGVWGLGFRVFWGLGWATLTVQGAVDAQHHLAAPALAALLGEAVPQGHNADPLFLTLQAPDSRDHNTNHSRRALMACRLALNPKP